MGMKKNKSQKQNGASSVTEKDAKNHDGKKVVTDKRFARVHSDPRFQKVPRNKAKVAVDSRFSTAFTNKGFAKSSAPLDKRGKLKKGSFENALSRYYSLEEEEDKKKGKKKNIEKEEENDEESDSDSVFMESGDELEPLKPKSKGDELEPLKPKSKGDDDEEEQEISEDDLVDGESSEEELLDMDSDATSSSTDTDEEDGVDLDDDDPVEVENVPTIEKETHRLAIVNMDWTQVKAADLFVVLSSFLPKEGHILSVSVYPSEFGIKCMEEEAIRGPAALFNSEEEKKKDKGTDDDEDEDDEDEDDDEIDNEKLRAYERSRLRYYYAVVVCDSVATADYLYKSCDGVEFERSSNVVDMRFIPDDMEFMHPPRDEATEAPTGYEGLDFHTRALQHSNVQISWDEDEPHRVKTLKRKFNADQLADLEMKEFLASDESEEDVDEAEDPSERKNRKSEKYRALLQSGNGSEGEEEEDERQDMEITFNTGLEDISKKILEKKNSKSETVWDAYLRKRKEKKLKSRSNDSSDDESDYSDKAGGEEPDDYFEEEPPTTKSKKKKASAVVAMETEKDGAATAAELELLVADENEGNQTMKGYKIKRGKMKKGKKGKNEALAEDKLPVVDLTDPRFAVIFNNPDFARDPTAPDYIRSAPYAREAIMRSQKAQEKSLNEELPSITHKSESASMDEAKPQKSTDKHELSMLVKSVKRKSQQVSLPSSDNGNMKLSTKKKAKPRP